MGRFKQDLPIYSEFDEDVKQRSFFSGITVMVKRIIFTLIVCAIGFAGAYGTFYATYAFTPRTEAPSNLMKEECFIQIPILISKCYYRFTSTKAIIDDAWFPELNNDVQEIATAYEKKAEMFGSIFDKQFHIRKHHFYIDPTMVLTAIYAAVTVFGLILVCIPLRQYEVPELEPMICKFARFVRVIFISYYLMLYVFGFYKLYYVYQSNCNEYF